MDNTWQGFGQAGQPYDEVTYTPCIDLTDGFVSTQQQPDVNVPKPTDIPTPCAETAAPQRKRGVPRRCKNFLSQEDETLCSAYLNVSKDPIVGTNQASKSYWARITEYFDEMKKTSFTRSQSSLQHRWGDIQKDTSRFCGFYAEIERKKQSGKSEDDKIKDALQMYEGIVGSQFKFLHCWFILRNEMKWTASLASASTAANDAPVGQQEDPIKEDTRPPTIPRPPGRDKAKKQRSSSTSSNANSSACLEVLQKMHVDRAAYEQCVDNTAKEEAREIAICAERKLSLLERQLTIQERMLQIQERQEEERVMSLDVEKMAPWVREYYIKKQKQIAAKSLSGEGDKNEEREKEIKQEFSQTCDWIKKRLGDKVARVDISNRLSSLPCVLVAAKFGWSANMERLMRAQSMGDTSSLDFMRSRKVFEINPEHEIIKGLNVACKNNPDDPEALKALDILFETAMISSGFTPDNAAELSGKIYEMMSSAIAGKWASQAQPATPSQQYVESGSWEPPEAEVVEPVEAGQQK